MSITYETLQNEIKPEISLDTANVEIAGLDAVKTIQWAYDQFGDGLYMSSSFGVESALMFDLVKRSGLDIPVVTIDTDFWFGATRRFKDQLAARYGNKIHVFGPTHDEFRIASRLVDKGFEEKKGSEVYDENVKKYNQVTKLEPMRRAVEFLGITALLSGVRADQTENRASLQKIDQGRYGEYRVHPALDWTEEWAKEYFLNEDLLRHPLFYQGYASVGDWPLTKPGSDRSESRAALGGKGLECGFNVADRNQQ